MVQGVCPERNDRESRQKTHPDLFRVPDQKTTGRSNQEEHPHGNESARIPEYPDGQGGKETFIKWCADQWYLQDQFERRLVEFPGGEERPYDADGGGNSDCLIPFVEKQRQQQHDPDLGLDHDESINDAGKDLVFALKSKPEQKQTSDQKQTVVQCLENAEERVQHHDR